MKTTKLKEIQPFQICLRKHETGLASSRLFIIISISSSVQQFEEAENNVREVTVTYHCYFSSRRLFLSALSLKF